MRVWLLLCIIIDLRKFDSPIEEARTLFGVLSHTAGPVHSDAGTRTEYM